MQDIRLLLHFAAVARTLSFTEAAHELGVAQPWLSARIRKLEDQLGFRLFERNTRRVMLTPEGRELERLVQPTVEASAQLLREIDYMRGTAQRRLRIGISHLGETDRRQSDLIIRFSRAYPSVSVEVEAGVADVHLERLARGHLDIVLAPHPLSGEEWEVKRLHAIVLAVMMRKGDPLAASGPLRVKDLAGRHVATFTRTRSPEIYDLVYGPLLEAGAVMVPVPELRRSLLRDAEDLLVSTLVPTLHDATLRYGLIRRRVVDAPMLALQMVRRRNATRSPHADRFWRMAAQPDS